MPTRKTPSDSVKTAASRDEIKAVNVRLPKDIINLLDLLIKQGLYNSRSEAVRDFARDHVNSATTLPALAPQNPPSDQQHRQAPSTPSA